MKRELKEKKNEILQEMKGVRSQHTKNGHCSYLAWLQSFVLLLDKLMCLEK